MDAQLKKGVLGMCILFQIREGEMYGYEILKRVRERFPDVYEGSVYTILRRLAAEGCAETVLRPAEGGPPRKYYRITAEGCRQLTRSVEEWRSLKQSVESLGSE